MARDVARFEKVPYEEFASSLTSYYKEKTFSEAELHMMYDNVELPKRATPGSVGYDFFMPFDATLTPGSQIMIPTGIRCVFLKEEFGLFLMPKSRNVNTSIRLSKTIAAIDNDYHKSKNYGHIMIFLEFPANHTFPTERSSLFGKIIDKFRRPYHYNVGDGFVQGIFHEIGLVEGEVPPEDERDGGFGSTDGLDNPVYGNNETEKAEGE